MDESKAYQIYSQIDRTRSGVVQYDDLANYLQNHPTIRDQIADEIEINDELVTFPFFFFSFVFLSLIQILIYYSNSKQTKSKQKKTQHTHSRCATVLQVHCHY